MGGNGFVCLPYAICEFEYKFEYKFEWVSCNWTFETEHDQNCSIIGTNETHTHSSFFLFHGYYYYYGRSRMQQWCELFISRMNEMLAKKRTEEDEINCQK